jgi:DNA-binding transcriptional LysR family regulator
MIEIEKSVHSKAKEFLNPKNVVLQVGISPLVNTKFVILLVSAFKANHKDHEVILVEQDLKGLQEKLVSGELDLIIAPKVSKTAIGNALSIYEEQLYLIDPADRDSLKVEIGDIRDKTFVMVPDSCGLSEITRSILRSTSRDFKEYEGKAMTYQVLVDWSANGLGCAILPKSKIPEGIKKTLITKRSKPIPIFFEAKWQPSQKKIKSFVKHLKTNSEKIYSGLV